LEEVAKKVKQAMSTKKLKSFFIMRKFVDRKSDYKKDENVIL